LCVDQCNYEIKYITTGPTFFPGNISIIHIHSDRINYVVLKLTLHWP